VEIQREAAINKSRILVNNEKIFIRLLKNKNVQYGFLDRALRQITETCAVSLQTSRVSVWLYDEDRKSIKCLDLYHLNSDRHSRGMELFQSEFPEYFKGIRDDKIIVASDAYQHERTKEFSDNYFKENFIYSLLDVPYYIDARFSGVVCIEQQHQYKGWTQEEVSFVKFVSYLITLAFKSKKRRDAEELLRASKIEIQEKNNELAQQNEEIITQRDLLEAQNEEIQDKNQQITAANQELQTFNQNLEDIIRQRTASLMKANEELQQVNMELDMFTYRASHDFKGPISTLQGLANLGLNESKDEFVNSLFEKIKITSTRMDTMLTKLLMVHSVNYKPTQISKINLEEMVEDVQNSLLHFIRRYGVKLQLSVESERFFFSDYELMNMVLQNLLENAIYFRSEQKPEIVIHLKNFENYTELNFRDNGDGIPDEYQNKIFEMFFRASEHSTGNGLGLYIVKKALEKLKGTIKVQSKANDYTVFSINLPKIKKEEAFEGNDQVLDLSTEMGFPSSELE
jgi:signal transduction histidine kinase